MIMNYIITDVLKIEIKKLLEKNQRTNILIMASFVRFAVIRFIRKEMKESFTIRAMTRIITARNFAGGKNLH